jgi:hypothetical protein
MKKTLMLLLLVSSALHAGAELSRSGQSNLSDKALNAARLQQLNDLETDHLAQVDPSIPQRPDLKVSIQLLEQSGPRKSDNTIVDDCSYTFTQGNGKPPKDHTSNQVSLGAILIDWKKRQADVQYRVGNDELEREIVPISRFDSDGEDSNVFPHYRNNLFVKSVKITASTLMTYANPTLPALKTHNKNLAKIILMVHLMDENHGRFCSKSISYGLDEKNNPTYDDSKKEISYISNNPIATAKNDRETQKLRSKASEYIYDIRLALLKMGMTSRNEKTATVEYSITKESKTFSALVQPPKTITFKLNKSCSNGHREMIQCEGEAPFSLLIKTKEL